MIIPVDSAEIRLREGVLTKLIGDEMVLLDYERGIYYGLNDVGARALSLLAEGHALSEVIDRLLKEFEVSRETLQSDLEELMADLRLKGLLDSV